MAAWCQWRGLRLSRASGTVGGSCEGDWEQRMLKYQDYVFLNSIDMVG